ncbi:hypothetical protein [Streptomyces marincola]|uniref:Uncharacterized protein n=1 Tax=Streptomyces marincola TaxID=2878388 RepID=A0A1W7D0C9_9ACTN|nr:hypothetical protein [Streptomyces marincola]ARQ70508.1 hypothetical protein CAG99_18150 [Streptomyces marincola]
MSAGTDPRRVDAAVRRLPALLRVAAAGPLAAFAGLLVWIAWGDPDQRFALLLGLLGLAGGALLVLAAHRLVAGRVHPADAARAVLDSPSGVVPSRALPAAVPPERGGRLWSGATTTVLACWALGFLFLAWGDPRPPAQVEEIRRAGGIVAEVPVIGQLSSEHDRAVVRGNRVPSSDTWTQTLQVELTDEAGEAHTAVIRTRSSFHRSLGDTVRVIYAPSAIHLGAWVGEDSRPLTKSWSSNFEGYQEDLPRILDGRTLSAYELWIWAGLTVVPLAFVVTPWFRVGRHGPVTRPGPGTRALRGTVRSGHVRSEDGRGVAFLPNGLAPGNLSPALEGRTGWLLWNAEKPREHLRSPGKKRGKKLPAVVTGRETGAVLVLDNGWAVHGDAWFPAPEDPAGVGVPGPEAPAVDKRRRVRLWAPRGLWPLTLSNGALVLYAVVLVCGGLLFTDVLSGWLRFATALVGAGSLGLAYVSHYPEQDDRFAAKE